MFKQIKTIALALLLGGFSTTASAEIVNLKSLDGNTTLSGDLVDFDGQTYTIRTIIGDLTVDAFQVECFGPGCPSVEVDAAVFNISGSSRVVGGLFGNLMVGFGDYLDGSTVVEEDDSGVNRVQLRNELGVDLADITFNANGSVAGLRDLIDGDADLALTTRPVREDEAFQFQQAGLGDLTDDAQAKIVAIDGLVIVISPSNPLRTVTQKDLAEIFSGNVGNWNQIGGPTAPINLYVRDNNSGTGAVFNSIGYASGGRERIDKCDSIGIGRRSRSSCCR